MGKNCDQNVGTELSARDVKMRESRPSLLLSLFEQFTAKRATCGSSTNFKRSRTALTLSSLSLQSLGILFSRALLLMKTVAIINKLLSLWSKDEGGDLDVIGRLVGSEEGKTEAELEMRRPSRHNRRRQ